MFISSQHQQQEKHQQQRQQQQQQLYNNAIKRTNYERTMLCTLFMAHNRRNCKLWLIEITLNVKHKI